MEEALLTPKEVKLLTDDIADSIRRHNKFYWWEFILIPSLLIGIFFLFTGALFLIQFFLIDTIFYNIFLFVIILICLILFFGMLLGMYDTIKAKIIVRIKYKKHCKEA